MNDNLTNLKKFFKELLKDKPTFGEKTKNSIENFCFRFQWGKWHQRDNTDPELVVEFNEGSWWTNGVLFNERGKLSKRKLELATAVPSPEVNVKYFYIMKYYDYDYDYDMIMIVTIMKRILKVEQDMEMKFNFIRKSQISIL